MTGTELRRLRLKAGLTQRELGTALDMNKNSIARMERGELAVRVVVALAAVHVCSCHQPTKGGKR